MTNTADVKNKVKKLIKEKFIDLDLMEFDKKVTFSGCKVYMDKEEIGTLDLSYVTSTASGFGSLFGVYAGCRVIGGKIALVIDQMGLSYQRYRQMPGYLSTTSLNEKFKKFGEKGGIIPFYEKDDLDEKCSNLINKLNTIFIPKFTNFALGEMEAIDDILESSTDYAYPMASIIVTCYLNDKKDLLEEMKKSHKTKKLYDSGRDKVEEILAKAENYFSNQREKQGDGSS